MKIILDQLSNKMCINLSWIFMNTTEIFIFCKREVFLDLLNISCSSNILYAVLVMQVERNVGSIACLFLHLSFFAFCPSFLVSFLTTRTT
jgi:hypothetical protein